MTSQIHECTLNEPDLAQARARYRQAAELYAAEAHIDGDIAHIDLRGEKPPIAALLDEMLVREAGCCSHLQFDVEEMAEGYHVTLRVRGASESERRALADALSILFPAAAIAASR